MTEQLSPLLHEMLSARRLLEDRRHVAAGTYLVEEARERMLSALERYTAALDTLCLPVPYALRDELRLVRRCQPPPR